MPVLSLEWLEKMSDVDKMTIDQCELRAQKEGFDTATFDLCGPLGKKSCKWLDAYFGFFQVEGSEGFIRASDFYSLSIDRLWCENFNSGANG